MMGLFSSLTIATLVGTILWIIQNSIRPVTEKIFSQSWHYYTTLIPVFFFLGGTEIIHRLIQLLGSVLSDRGTSLMLRAGTLTEEYPYQLESGQSNAGSTLINHLFTSLSQLENRKEIVLFVTLIWAVGVILFLAVNVKTYWKFKHFILQDSRVFDAAQCSVKVLICPNATTSIVMGLWKPVMILPDIDLEEKEFAMILTHELVHLKRRDIFIKLMVLAAQAIHWFNPMVFSLSRQLNTFCEFSCDDKVVQSMDIESRRYYGEMILSMLDYGVMKRNVVNVICVNNLCHSKRNIKKRLMNMMNAKRTKKSMFALSLAATIALAGIGTYVAYAAESSISKMPKPYHENVNNLLQRGYNISVQDPDGTAITYDKDGNATETKGKILLDSLLTDKQKLELKEIDEEYKSYLELGIPAPQEFLDALNRIYGSTFYHD